MACVVRYSFLLISLCLRSTSKAEAQLKVTVTTLNETDGNEVIIQCTTDKTPQDGVYMYKQEANNNKFLVFYYYKDGTLTPKSEISKNKVKVNGKFPNLNATFLNVNGRDIGLYWCEFNQEDKVTVGKLTWLWIDKKTNKTGEGQEKGETEMVRTMCPEDSHVKTFLIVSAVISLLCIIGFIFVILKVRGHGRNKKYSPSNPPSDSVYEEMKRSSSDAHPSVRTFINPDYQATKLLR
ncbi:uncharacterized protein LOC127166349 isoform X2 [Labeo rohita]|uniref:uncharacterized protein LOC127166349 isoform X2 n=1 Tax=Labeo rohita TaxID=84645 RepID=UPI0021E24650|nr:uncharacterized protein LOC127166349 isoform X2 [Labeo rohita]